MGVWTMLIPTSEKGVSGMLGTLWGHPIDFWDKIGYAAMWAGGILGAIGLVVSLGASIVLYRVADVQGEVIKANAAATEERLLHERRLTANERWRLERVEKIVLPRTLTQEQHDQIVAALKGVLPSINLYTMEDSEPLMFSLALKQALEAADIKVTLHILPAGRVRKGVITYAPNQQGQDFAGVGGGSMGIVSMELAGAIKEGETALIVGLNDAVMQPQAGQPGEGIDANGIPFPAP